MKFAITPCPNDTFAYYALIKGIVPSDFEFVFDDIEDLNLSAERGEYPITKMSFANYSACADKYELLDAGAALGEGTGPVLVGLDEVFDETCDVAVPGVNTTAALLLKYCYGKNVKMTPMHFRSILDAVSSGRFRAGVLIHEGRFVFRSAGAKLLCDLGAYWSEKTSLPVPLGCICVRRDFAHLKTQIENAIRDSLKTAFDNPEAAYPYVKSMAQYLEDDVLQKHIYAFVNRHTFDISPIRGKLLEELSKC